MRSFKTAVAHFSSTSVDEDQQRNSVPYLDGTQQNGVPHLDGTQQTAQTAQQNDAPQSRHEETKRHSAPRRNTTNSANGATKRRKRRNKTAQTAQQNSANSATKRCLHLHCNATNTIATIVKNATNNDDNR